MTVSRKKIRKKFF